MQRLTHLLIAVLPGVFLLSGLPAAAQTWEQVAKLISGSGGDSFGGSVAVSGDTAVIGAPGDDDLGSNAGAAYVFTRNGTGWVQQAKLFANDGAAFDAFGVSVAVSGDTAVIGATGHDDLGSHSGSAYVFVRNGTSWVQQAKLLANDGSAFASFGVSVAVSGDTAVIGASGTFLGSPPLGSAYVFVRNGTSWVQQAKLLANDGVAGDQFGILVAISDNTAVIGAEDGQLGSLAGSAYVFVRNGTNWAQQAKLLASDAVGGDLYGISVALSGDTAVIGANGDEDFGFGSGAAYVYVRNGTVWNQQAKLLANDGAQSDFFGASVAVSGDTVMIGAELDIYPGGQGSAYVFVRSGTDWAQQAKLLADDGTAGSQFGFSMALSGDTAVIGSAGAAYVFAPTISAVISVILNLLLDDES